VLLIARSERRHRAGWTGDHPLHHQTEQSTPEGRSSSGSAALMWQTDIGILPVSWMTRAMSGFSVWRESSLARTTFPGSSSLTEEVRGEVGESQNRGERGGGCAAEQDDEGRTLRARQGTDYRRPASDERGDHDCREGCDGKKDDLVGSHDLSLALGSLVCC